MVAVVATRRSSSKGKHNRNSSKGWLRGAGPPDGKERTGEPAVGKPATRPGPAVGKARTDFRLPDHQGLGKPGQTSVYLITRVWQSPDGLPFT